MLELKPHLERSPLPPQSPEPTGTVGVKAKLPSAKKGEPNTRQAAKKVSAAPAALAPVAEAPIPAAPLVAEPVAEAPAPAAVVAETPAAEPVAEKAAPGETLPESLQRLLDTRDITQDELAALKGTDGKYITHSATRQKLLNRYREQVREAKRVARAAQRAEKKAVVAQLEGERQAAEHDAQFESSLNARIAENQQAQVQERTDFVENYEPSPISIDFSPGRDVQDVAGDVREQFGHNTSLALRIIRSQVRRLNELRNQAAAFDANKVAQKFERRRLRINWTIREIPLHFERVAVADAQDNLHQRQQERRTWENRRDRNFRALGIPLRDQACFGARLAIAQELRSAQAGNVVPNNDILDQYRVAAAIDSMQNPAEIQAFLTTAELSDWRYRAYNAANDAYYGTRFPGRQNVFPTDKGVEIKIENCRAVDQNLAEARSNLADAQQEEKRIAAVEAKGIKASKLAQHLEAQIAELADLSVYLTAEDGYIPTAESVEGAFTELENARSLTVKRENALRDLPPSWINNRAMRKGMAELTTRIAVASTDLNSLISPSKRTQVLGVVQRGMTLRAQSRDLNALPPEDRFYAVLADTLLAKGVTENINDLVDVAGAPPAVLTITSEEIVQPAPTVEPPIDLSATIEEAPVTSVEMASDVVVAPLKPESPPAPNASGEVDLRVQLESLTGAERTKYLRQLFASNPDAMAQLVNENVITQPDLMALFQKDISLPEDGAADIAQTIPALAHELMVDMDEAMTVEQALQSGNAATLYRTLTETHHLSPAVVASLLATNLNTQLEPHRTRTDVAQAERNILLGLHAVSQPKEAARPAA